MSHSPEQKRDESSLSPTKPPPQEDNATAVIEVTVHSVMDGVKDAKICVPLNANVFELKRHICIVTEVAPERQLLLYKDKELRDDDAPISSYGIVDSCSLTMNVKMNTGLQMEQQRLSAAEMFILLPVVMPIGNLSSLRNTIRTMTDVNEQNSGKNLSAVDDSSTKWTPAKQMEHELTRNRMKKLLRKRKRTTILSDTTPARSPGSLVSEPTSPAEPVENASPAHSPSGRESNEVTEKELKCFFEPPESLEESLRKKHDLFTPPENVDELEDIRMKREELLKTTCKVCGRKLPLPEQQIRCRCRLVFCRKHREPGAHLCQIDYKHTGRSKIIKENPKVDGDGSRRGMCD
ncbi:hypothetical protein Y032_0023g753 [Ancylostoma ceylanicum]|uniref:Ubiquitin-like domain-containing protein n=1 Tax=Ancylostoma ceylanicum TaxID=53326 RepID=A0A016UXC1_9BILA|nr:hypothetical protein Y032_0023g753 [Ancylostoma ceylanicum]